MNQSQLQAVVFGGLFIGILSALPIVSIGNCACCLWIVGGGMLTAYLLQRDQPQPLALGEGAVNGLLAGVVGSFVYVVVSIPIDIVTAPLQRRMMEFVMDANSDMPPEVREMLESFGAESLVVSVAIDFLFMLFAGAVFASLGGLFGVLLFRPSSPTPPSPSPGAFPTGPPPPPPGQVPPLPPPAAGV